MSISRSLLRGRGSLDSGKVGMVELFFDLVFVFAVTQLSHSLLAQLSILGAVQVALLMVAVWWVWIFTSWITNWLDPEKLTIRLGLFGLMIAGLLLSSSIPKAFTERGLMFASAFVFMQVGRTLFAIWAVRGESLSMTRRAAPRTPLVAPSRLARRLRCNQLRRNRTRRQSPGPSSGPPAEEG